MTETKRYLRRPMILPLDSPSRACASLSSAARVAHLQTADAFGTPHNVPLATGSTGEAHLLRNRRETKTPEGPGAQADAISPKIRASQS